MRKTSLWIAVAVAVLVVVFGLLVWAPTFFAESESESGSSPASSSSPETKDGPAESAVVAPVAKVSESDLPSVVRSEAVVENGVVHEPGAAVDSGARVTELLGGADSGPPDGELAVDGDPTECSMKTELKTEVLFLNDCSETVDVSWIDFSCRERIYKTIEPADRHTQSTYVTHVWRVRSKKSGRLLQQNVPMSAERLTVRACGDKTVRDRSAPDSGSELESCAPRPVTARDPPQCSVRAKTADVDLTFVNNCQGTAVALFWVDYDCKEQPYGLLNAGASKVQHTFVTHTWRFRDATTGKLHGEFIPRTPNPGSVPTCDCR